MRSIHFTNTLPLSDNPADVKFNARRTEMVPLIESYIQGSNFFKDGDTFVTFMHTGVSSLVSKIVSGDKTYILKIPLTTVGFNLGGMFFRAWTGAGVKTPRVFDEPILGSFPGELIEFIDAPMIGDKYSHGEMVEKGIYQEMGRTLRKMHEPRGNGYGAVVNGAGEYKTFREWIEGTDMQKRFKYAQEHNLFPSVISLLPMVIETLIEHSIHEKKSSYCHMDFGGNIFATEPMTVFDPNPTFHNRYVDIGRTVTNFLAQGVYPKQLVDGYFESEQKDERVLYAATFLNIIMKAPYSHQKGLSDRLVHWEKYLVEGEGCLD